MDAARFRRNCRILFFLGAMVAFIGIGLYLMEMTWGVALLIAGIVVLVLTLSVTRFFAHMEYQQMLMKARVEKVKREEEERKRLG